MKGTNQLFHRDNFHKHWSKLGEQSLALTSITSTGHIKIGELQLLALNEDYLKCGTDYSFKRIYFIIIKENTNAENPIHRLIRSRREERERDVRFHYSNPWEWMGLLIRALHNLLPNKMCVCRKGDIGDMDINIPRYNWIILFVKWTSIATAVTTWKYKFARVLQSNLKSMRVYAMIDVVRIVALKDLGGASL